MATRSRKVADNQGNGTGRAGRSNASATPSATQRVAPTRATRSTRTVPTPMEESTTTSTTFKSRIVAKKAPTDKAKPVAAPVKKAPARAKTKTLATVLTDENDREPIKAFLRIRPNNINEGSHQQELHTPYLKALSETTVQMTDQSPSRFRAFSSIPPVTTYTFTHVFESTAQSSFFVRSALPLVQYLLAGENGLLFAYGVTNSGKTYSIQGGRGEEEAGILPRTLDVVFNSIKGLQSDRYMRPKGLGGVEFLDKEDATGLETLTEKEEKASAMVDQVLGDGEASAMVDDSADATTLPVDKNYEYAVWLSYAEVYNEKIFDLLTVSDSTTINTDIPKSQSISGAISSYMNLAALAASTGSGNNVPVTLHRRALPLKSSPDGLGKYVQGLREVKVRNAEEAKAVVRMGTINRRVFGTLANAVSSRSHAIFTVRLVKIHRGAGAAVPAEEDITVSRLAIVDLAGSERARNAGTSRIGEGDRLREAGNINKSLMVLGQCMEAMRMNQKRLAAAGATGPPKDDDAIKPGLVEKPKLAIVPFRHSKITELFQDFFIGEGRAVMIININPYDTGFDENAHVMRFAALAREVTTNQTVGFPAFNLSRGAPFLPPSNAASRAPSRLAGVRTIQSNTRRVMLSLGGNGRGGRGSVNTVVDVIEEDPDNVDGEEEDDQAYPLVEELFRRIEELEIKLYEAEMRAAMVETETREEVALEMEERMQMMDKMYRERISRENEENDRKTDEKMDLLHRALKTGGTISPVKKKSRITEETMFEEDVLMAPSSPDEVDMLDASPSVRKSQLPRSKPTSPRKSKPTLPRKSARAASVEVPDSEEEPEIPHVPDLKKNPIMDMEEEEEAAATGSDTETGNSQAEEVDDDESADVSSEGEGETIPSEEVSGESEDIDALEESEEDEDRKPKFVFEPLRPAKASKAIAAKSKGKAQRVIESSDEDESFDLKQVHTSESEGAEGEEVVSDKPPTRSKKPVKPVPKTKPKGAAAKAPVKKKVLVDSTDDEMENLTKKIGKTTLGTKSKATRTSTRAKAG